MTSTPLRDKVHPITGKTYWAYPERPNNHEHRAVKVCPECGHEVAFVQSTKTGKWYLCDVHESNAVKTDPKTGVITKQFSYDSASPHFKTCQYYQRLSAG